MGIDTLFKPMLIQHQYKNPLKHYSIGIHEKFDVFVQEKGLNSIMIEVSAILVVWAISLIMGLM